MSISFFLSQCVWVCVSGTQPPHLMIFNVHYLFIWCESLPFFLFMFHFYVFGFFYLFSISIFNHLKFKTSRCPSGFSFSFSSSAAVQMDSSPFVHDAICDIRCYAFAVLSLLFLFIITTDYNLIYPIPPLALSYSHISMYLSSACVDFRSPHPTIRKKKWILLGV